MASIPSWTRTPFLAAMAAAVAIPLSAAPAFADLIQDKAACFKGSGGPAAVVEICTRVLADSNINPTEKAEASYRRAMALLDDRKNADAALADLDQAIALKPDNGDYFSGRGAAFRAKANFRQAIANYDKAIELKLDKTYVYFLRGENYYRLDDFARAITDFNHALELNPEQRETLYLRGHAYAKTGKPDLALADFTHYLVISPFHSASFVSRGEVYEKMGDKQRAISDFRIAVLLNPNWEQADEAIKRLAPVEKLNPPAEPIAFAAPAPGAKFSYVQIENKDIPEKDDMEKAIADLAGWFNKPPLPTASRGTRFDLVIGEMVKLNTLVTTTRTAAFPAVANPPEQKLAMYRSLWPHVWPGPGNQRMVIDYLPADIDKLWPAKIGQTTQGEAKVFLPRCPPGEDPARAALACIDQRLDLGVTRWKAEVLRYEQIVVPAGKFDALVIRHQEDVELSMMGQTLKRSTVAHFWYAPSVKWWVRRTTQAEGQIAIVELVDMK